MSSNIDLSSVESQLKTDANGSIDIEEMGSEAHIYYDITNAQSTRYTVGAVFIGKEPRGTTTVQS